MWDKIQYAFLYSWVKVHALLPMRALYVLSDILYVLIYKIAGYRVKVERRNITASFPDKSKAELRQLERRFSIISPIISWKRSNWPISLWMRYNSEPI